MKWKILNKTSVKNKTLKEVAKILLQNRGVKTESQVRNFLNTRLSDITSKSVGISKDELKKSIARINRAIKNKEQIVVFGDYDADGICAAAIIWESLISKGAKITPYIPHRADEGYGLSIKGIKNLKTKVKNCSLIITVDNGIVANDAVDFANSLGIDVIITDHHTKLEKVPNAYSIVHTTKLCAAGIAWVFTKELTNKEDNEHLILAGIATIADLVPLTNENRIIVKQTLEKIKKTSRVGLLEIIKEAGLTKEKIGVYEISYIIAPRLNASGRIEKAMDSLRLLCTKNKHAASLLADKLGSTNRKRQKITEETLLHAKSKFKVNDKKKLIFVYDKTYEQGVIGLVAGKLVEEYYLPAIVLSKGEKYTKASARSVSGFNIINFIREAKDFLIDAGGHPMAAGFTVETEKLDLLQKKLETLAEKLLNKKLLTREVKIDCEIPLQFVSLGLFSEIEKLEPFGMGNPTPTFLTKNLTIYNMQTVGLDAKHVRFFLKEEKDNAGISAIAFNFKDKVRKIGIGDRVDIVYTILVDEWNGNKRLQLKIKDLVGFT